METEFDQPARSQRGVHRRIRFQTGRHVTRQAKCEPDPESVCVRALGHSTSRRGGSDGHLRFSPPNVEQEQGSSESSLSEGRRKKLRCKLCGTRIRSPTPKPCRNWQDN
ncbi:hypothetical protein VNO77_19972 [Canavalia gladiata]|uniref:Ig-like domain-containing protein n=1 Tax=Canavalia gladiata TaxID=3824 RepID=A0AAN9LSB2_CANGL